MLIIGIFSKKVMVTGGCILVSAFEHGSKVYGIMLVLVM